MSCLFCPIDDAPCDPGCPDRYIDRPEGGCILTTVQELGGCILIMNENSEIEKEMNG